ncbi:hypothetical protein [Streptomyces anulatus]|uniref:DUF3761 domain-containing protein n=1 Tax=Streptomyces anulatus TaxID=1892 RepID=A0A7K3RMM2_STRAQ|nr:hypothetical protein [Streptomyces anulatus]NEC03421.1 hypothetical protein [Streptomyces anulatus]NED30721.1 hypothetical protein [Streptomyces anulatus]
MTTPTRRTATRIREAARGVRTITTWTLTVCSALLWVLLITIGIAGMITDGTDDKPTTQASAPATPQILTPGTPIQWQPAGQTCADGWISGSIGKRGACSHHGGVVTVYESTPGGLTTICLPVGHPKTLERARQLAGTARTVPCDFPDE